MLPREWVRDIIRLDSQSVCPRCRVNWVLVEEMLNECPSGGGLNNHLATE
jgi:hypothetical protein